MSGARRNQRAAGAARGHGSPVVIFPRSSPPLSRLGTEPAPADLSAGGSDEGRSVGEKGEAHSSSGGGVEGEGESSSQATHRSASQAGGASEASMPPDEAAPQGEGGEQEQGHEPPRPKPALPASIELPEHVGADGLFLDSSRSGRKLDTLCVVCFDHARNTRLPCGHSVMCKQCAKGVLHRSKQCPTCRSPFDHFFVSDSFEHEPAYRPCTDRDKATHRVITEEEAVRRLRQRDPQLLRQLERERERENQRLASLELDVILSSFLDGIDDRGDAQMPQHHRCLHLVLTITLICIFQGFIFMDCNHEQVCQCSELRFADGYTCAEMCACEGTDCSIGLNATQRQSFCQGTRYRTWTPYASDSCWSESDKYSCERNVSGYLFLVGMCTLFLLLVHVFCRSCCHMRRGDVEDPPPQPQEEQRV